MSELTLTVFRLGMVILLWFFVFSVVGVLRSDLYGTAISRRGERRAARAASKGRSRGERRATAVPGAAAPAALQPLPGGPGSPAAPGAGGPGAPGIPTGAPGAPPPGAKGASSAYNEYAPQQGGGGIPRHLVVTEGRLAGTTLPLRAAGVLIGRNPECALVLDDDFASGRHARVFNRAGAWHAEDLGSTNGTFLDGARLVAAQPLRLGSTLRIGRTVIEVRG